MTITFHLLFDETQKAMCDQLVKRYKPRLDRVDDEMDHLGDQNWWLSQKIKSIEGILNRKNLSQERREYNQKRRIELKNSHILVQERLNRLKKYQRKVLEHGQRAVLRAYEAASKASEDRGTNA